MLSYLLFRRAKFSKIDNDQLYLLLEKSKYRNIFLLLHDDPNVILLDRVRRLTWYDFCNNCYLVTYYCMQNMTFCNEMSKKLPVWINLSPGLNFNDSMKYVVESYANLTDIFEKPPENNTVNINNDYHLIRNLPINGGTTFHLRASNYSGNLDTYSQISQMYNPKIFKINFT